MKRILTLLLFGAFLLQACSKDIAEEDLVKSTEGISVFDINARNVFGMQKIPGVGYTVLYSASENFTFASVGSALIKENGSLVSSNTYGGSLNDLIASYTYDEDGNTYVCGSTYSPEIRINTVPSPYNPSDDAFLCKLDDKGDLVWQIGYSDTATANFGSLGEVFQKAEVVGDSIYCYGQTQNYENLGQPNPNDLLANNWLVVFDKNGNYGSKRLLPTLQKSRALGPVSPRNLMIKSSNNDLIIINSLDRNFQPIPPTYDTTCVITRYSTSTKSILWTKYITRDAAEADINQVVELSNGDLFCLNSLSSKTIKLNGNSGDLISSNDMDIFDENRGANAFYDGDLKRVGDNLYVVGFVSNAVGFSIGVDLNGANVFKGSQPWLVKMDLSGAVVYSKFYDVTEGGFSDILQKDNGNLQLVGGLAKYGTLSYSGFLLTVDSNGNIVTNN